MGRVTWQQLEVGGGGVAAADILDGFQTFAVTTAATTVIAVPAGRTWQGNVAISCAVDNTAAAVPTGAAVAVVSTAGAGVTPAAGSYIRCDALAGGGAAGGTVGEQASATMVVPFVVVAPVGNVVQIQATATIAGSGGQVSVSAIGALL